MESRFYTKIPGERVGTEVRNPGLYENPLVKGEATIGNQGLT
jgi:hypothetical protein